MLWVFLWKYLEQTFCAIKCPTPARQLYLITRLLSCFSHDISNNKNRNPLWNIILPKWLLGVKFEFSQTNKETNSTTKSIRSENLIFHWPLNQKFSVRLLWQKKNPANIFIYRIQIHNQLIVNHQFAVLLWITRLPYL